METDTAERSPLSFCGELDEVTEPLQACSACAGDYEDPDRTAWADERPDEDEGDAWITADNREEGEECDEFPAEET